MIFVIRSSWLTVDSCCSSTLMQACIHTWYTWGLIFAHSIVLIGWFHHPHDWTLSKKIFLMLFILILHYTYRHNIVKRYVSLFAIKLNTSLYVTIALHYSTNPMYQMLYWCIRYTQHITNALKLKCALKCITQ